MREKKNVQKGWVSMALNCFDRQKLGVPDNFLPIPAPADSTLV